MLETQLTDPRTIREIFERHVRTLTHKPARGLLTFATTARRIDGLRCEITDGAARLTAALPASLGGDDTVPSPGMLGRGALASCLVTQISRWAARLDVPLDALEVEVQADIDARGELGIGDDVRPGYGEVRYIVSVRSPASHAAIADLLATAERHNPYLDIFGRPVPLRGSRQINRAGA
jgi:uncharacterized OsmC-like protein